MMNGNQRGGRQNNASKPTTNAPHKKFAHIENARKPPRKTSPAAGKFTASPSRHLEQDAQPKSSSVKKSLFERLLATLVKSRDVRKVDSELHSVALQEDPSEVAAMNKDQLSQLTSAALEAETYQSTLFAASIVEQMADDKLLEERLIKFVVEKLRQPRDWRRLLGQQTSADASEQSIRFSTLLKAYETMVERTYGAWKEMYNKNTMRQDELPVTPDYWIEFWLTFFDTVDPYAATLACACSDPIASAAAGEEARMRFFDHLHTKFLSRLESEEAGTEWNLSKITQCFAICATPLEHAIADCIRVEYETDRSATRSLSAEIDQSVQAVTAKCSHFGPYLLRGGMDENGEEIKVNNDVRIRMHGVILRGLLTGFETASDHGRLMNGVIHENLSGLFDQVLFQVEHSCMHKTHCDCHVTCPDPVLVQTCERLLLDRLATMHSVEFTQYVDQVAAHYHNVPNEKLTHFFLAVYPSAKREVTKKFHSIIEMIQPASDRKRHSSLWLDLILTLLIKMSADNAKLFDAKSVKVIEKVLFSNDPNSASKALFILRNVAANNARVMVGCGKDYYTVAAALPHTFEAHPMTTVNHILRNIGLQEEHEAERVVALMQNEIKHSGDKTFIEDVLCQWHYIAIVYPEPLESRRPLIDSYREDPVLCKAAYEVFSLSTGQHNTTKSSHVCRIA